VVPPSGQGPYSSAAERSLGQGNPARAAGLRDEVGPWITDLSELTWETYEPGAATETLGAWREQTIRAVGI
jgi:hypothetical protein